MLWYPACMRYLACMLPYPAWYLAYMSLLRLTLSDAVVAAAAAAAIHLYLVHLHSLDSSMCWCQVSDREYFDTVAHMDQLKHSNGKLKKIRIVRKNIEPAQSLIIIPSGLDILNRPNALQII